MKEMNEGLGNEFIFLVRVSQMAGCVSLLLGGATAQLQHNVC